MVRILATAVCAASQAAARVSPRSEHSRSGVYCRKKGENERITRKKKGCAQAASPAYRGSEGRRCNRSRRRLLLLVSPPKGRVSERLLRGRFVKVIVVIVESIARRHFPASSGGFLRCRRRGGGVGSNGQRGNMVHPPKQQHERIKERLERELELAGAERA